MKRNLNTEFNITSGTDLAFALVVLISYFATFSKPPQTSLFLITILICLGIAYITLGIYGFAFVNQYGKLIPKLIYFALQLTIAGFIVYFGKGAGFNALILLPLVAHTAMTLDQDWILVANASIFLTFVLSVLSYTNNWSVVWLGLPTFFAGQVFILIFTEMAYTEQKARIKMEKLADDLSEANRHLSEYALQVKDLTISQERNRLAREIHDGLGHYLTTINMQIKAALVILQREPLKTKELLNKAQELTTEALEDVRNSVYSLREDNTGALSLTERITKLIQASESEARKIFFEVKGESRSLTPQVDISLFRVVQEALNNANKHSLSTQVFISLNFSQTNVVSLTIEDNGVGSESATGGFGLIGMKERIRLINGNINIITAKNKGFCIEVSAPG
ncbi:MAG: sensor histidine kinase [Anaerolineaceae bacterium]